MAALKVEATQLNTRTLTKLNAAMEQSRSLKAWREQQNVRILEMQVKRHRHWVDLIKDLCTSSCPTSKLH